MQELQGELGARGRVRQWGMDYLSPNFGVFRCIPK